MPSPVRLRACGADALERREREKQCLRAYNAHAYAFGTSSMLLRLSNWDASTDAAPCVAVGGSH
eukprot:9944688-Ditylum_brightwellii.AAC.1